MIIQKKSAAAALKEIAQGKGLYAYSIKGKVFVDVHNTGRFTEITSEAELNEICARKCNDN